MTRRTRLLPALLAALGLLAGSCSGTSGPPVPGAGEPGDPDRFEPLSAEEVDALPLEEALLRDRQWPFDDITAAAVPTPTEVGFSPAVLPDVCGDTPSPRALAGLQRTWEGYTSQLSSTVVAFEQGRAVPAVEMARQLSTACAGPYDALPGVIARPVTTPQIDVEGADDLVTFASTTALRPGLDRIKAVARVGQLVTAVTIISPRSARPEVLDGTFEAIVQDAVTLLLQMRLRFDDERAADDEEAAPAG